LTASQLVIRIVVGALLVGMPSYLVGTLAYSGRHLPKLALACVGAPFGAGMALAVLVGYSDPPALVIGSLVSACFFAIALIMVDTLVMRSALITRRPKT
jgi:formate/nitrite transporter FocA (FNT family)